MEDRRDQWLAAIAAAVATSGAWAQQDITYQGELLKDGQLINDTADLVFRLYDAPTGGTQVGVSVSVMDHTLIEGRFTAHVAAHLNGSGTAHHGSIRLAAPAARSCTN